MNHCRWKPLLFLLLAISGPLAAVKEPVMDSNATEARWKHYMQDKGNAKARGGFPYAQCFQKAAIAHDLPQSLLMAVARGESNFDPKARSSAEAYGLMQILWPQTARHLGITRKQQLLDPCTNVDAGARYLKEMLQRYDGNLHRALAAYNYGPARIPVKGGTLPTGAVWYSGYILTHLDYVTDGNLSSNRLFVIHFSRPYRAAAFVNNLQPKLKGIRLEWFRRPQGGFDVMMQYDSVKQRSKGIRRLSELGITIRS